MPKVQGPVPHMRRLFNADPRVSDCELEFSEQVFEAPRKVQMFAMSLCFIDALKIDTDCAPGDIEHPGLFLVRDETAWLLQGH